jgi:hypothetical protein
MLSSEHDASVASSLPSPASGARQLGIEIWLGILHNVPNLCSVKEPNGNMQLLSDTPAAVLLQNDADGAIVSGHIAFGSADAAPTLDALPAFSSSFSQFYQSFWECAPQGLTEGFDYQMLAVQRSPGRLAFALSREQLWQTWCCQPDGTYACPAQVQGQYMESQRTPVTACTDRPVTDTFNLRIDGETMEGSVTPSYTFPATELRLRRQH